MSDFFGSFFAELLFVCAASVLCDAVCETSVSKGIAASLKIVCSLCICAVVFSFSPASVKNVNFGFAEYDFRNSGYVSDEIIIERTREELEKNMSETIYQKFGIKPVSVSISFSKEEKDGICEVNVNSAKAVLPPDTDGAAASAIRIFVEETLVCGSETYEK